MFSRDRRTDQQYLFVIDGAKALRGSKPGAGTHRRQAFLDHRLAGVNRCYHASKNGQLSFKDRIFRGAPGVVPKTETNS